MQVYQLKVELDKCERQDIMDLLAFIDVNRGARFSSITVLYTPWAEGLKLYERAHGGEILERIRVDSFTILKATKEKVFSILPKVSHSLKICQCVPWANQ